MIRRQEYRVVLKENSLVFLPIGGCNEIGMNLNAYGFGPPDNRKWIIIDVGVSFADEQIPGIDIICPDPSYLEDMQDNILAILFTHAHEDHIGAIGHLWPRLRAPLYATPFTAELIKHKLTDKGLINHVELNVIPLEARFQIGPFDIQYVTLTHSIPEPNAIAIHTELGTIFHTGDWKIDPDPLIGADFDQDTIAQLGSDGILAMVCDSTNVFVEGEAGSEASCRESLTQMIAEQTGRVAVGTFASNVARLESVMKAALANDRHVCLVGRSMERIFAAAKAVGMLNDIASLISEADSLYLPPENILYLCTGSQGEPNAALTKIAEKRNISIELGKGDSVIFSSRVIPGNEKAIGRLQDRFADNGVKVLTPTLNDIHVSGHPCRDELRRIYQWVKPQIAIPVHGQRRHILEHARLAEALQVPISFTPRNGDLLHLAPGPASVIDEVPSGRLLYDGAKLIPEHSTGIVERRKIGWTGYICISLVLDEVGQLCSDPIISLKGLSGEEGIIDHEDIEALIMVVEDKLAQLSRTDLGKDDMVAQKIYQAVRRRASDLFGKRPVTDIHVHRI